MSNRLLKASPKVFSKKLIAIGASFGGPGVLRQFLQTLPPEIPGMVIALHMPAKFTELFSERLNEVCRIEVREAGDGDRIMPGKALIAPGGRDILVVRRNKEYVVEVIDGTLIDRVHPNVDALFSSVAKAAGANAIGVILTGMGHDGALGLLEMKQAGAVTIAQDENTCAVFGMPKQAIDLGAVDEVVPLSQLTQAILRRI